MIVQVAYYLVLQTLDGRDVHVNPAYVATLSEPDEDRDPKKKLMTDKVHCVVTLLNNLRVSVGEDCDSVKARMEALK
jgi:hypothetical protein